MIYLKKLILKELYVNQYQDLETRDDLYCNFNNLSLNNTNNLAVIYFDINLNILYISKKNLSLRTLNINIKEIYQEAIFCNASSFVIVLKSKSFKNFSEKHLHLIYDVFELSYKTNILFKDFFVFYNENSFSLADRSAFYAIMNYAKREYKQVFENKFTQKFSNLKNYGKRRANI